MCQMMLIKVKLLNGVCKNIEVEPTMKIIELKQMLEEAEGISPEQQRLIFAGKQLADEKTLQELKIGVGTQISLLLALTGGY